MSLMEKLYTFIIFFAVVIGITGGQIEIIQKYADAFIIPFLMVMLYITFLQIPMNDIKTSFQNIKFTLTNVLINFVWTPLFAWLLALLLLGDEPALFIGFIMLMVTPCTDWFLVFTGIAKGNVALSTAILPLNLILQVILLPIYLLVFAGTTGFIEPLFLFESIVTVLIIPFVLALFTKRVLKTKQAIRERLLSKLSVFPIIFLSLAIVAMFASQGQLLLENLELMWKITMPILLFFVVNFIFSQRIARRLRFPNADRVSLTMTTLARNSPIALAIAMTAFPEQPLIALTLVIGPLLELPILAIVTQLLIFSKRKK